MALSRRTLLMMGGGAAAVAAVPAVQHVSWSGRNFVRADYSDAPPPSGGWNNWSGILRTTPERVFVPASEDELISFMKSSTGRVRPVGSGHSFTALVPSTGTLVDISRLSGLISHDIATQTVTFGAGTRLRQAAQDMAEIGLAWPNQPDIDVQTLAGSFATATHGTGLGLKAIHDQIEGFRLITATGEVMDVTRASAPELFSAGKVSLGALGIITQYTLRMEKSYNLRRRVWIERIGPLMERLPELAKTHRNFECYYFPGSGAAAAIAHDLHEGPVSGAAPGDDDTLLNDLKSARDQLGWSPWLRRQIMASGLPKGTVEDVTDASWRLLSTARPIKFNEMEYHLPLEAGIKGLRDIVNYLDRLKEAYFPVEFRYTGADDATLSPFNNGPCCSIATHAGVDERYDYFFSEIEPLQRAKGGRPHWGKLHSLGKSDLTQLYAGFDAFCEIRKSLDPTGRFLNRHLGHLFGEMADD